LTSTLRFFGAFALAASSFCAPSATAAPDDGPAVAFERRGDSVCARYLITERHHLYPKKLAAFDGSRRLAISGAPAGRSLDASSEPVATAPFVACAKTAPGASARWIDQSCLAAEGVCLPPRAFDVDAQGRARQLPGNQAAQAFSQAFLAPSSPTSQGWGALVFKPR
jgi:hypothetical protein